MVVVSETSLATEPRTVVKVFQEKEVEVPAPGMQFLGSVREWYETFAETILAASTVLWKRHLQPPTVVEMSPELVTLLEHTVVYSPNFKLNDLGQPSESAEVLPMTRGPWVGTLNNRLKVVRVDTMKSNEAVVVLTTSKRAVYKPLAERVKVPAFEEDFEAPQVPEVSVECIPLQRLDEFTVRVLDMNLL